jgi:16S rRNA (uracil1498-N3)-methyltransferase
MRVSRLFVAQTFREGDSLLLDAETSHYVRGVLRLRKGFDLTVFNGEGLEHAAQVDLVCRDEVRLAVGAPRCPAVESQLHTHLGLGISRGERMDYAVQKATELGVTRITPLFTEHCVVRLDEEKQGTRHLHWQKVSRSACEQSGRTKPPHLDEPLALEDWLDRPAGLRLLFDPQGDTCLRDLPAPEAGDVTLLSGPEGGFSDRERNLARQAGFTPVRLGPRILRTETAVLAALSVVQSLWGDWVA